MSDLLVIDGNSIMNRAFYGIPLLKNSKGLYTNAVYGFINILFKTLEEEKPNYVAVAFDLKKPTFRHLQYKEYKANRKGMPLELVEQMPLIKQILGIMKINILEKEGFEADDILGCLSQLADNENKTCTILTGDRDALQLVSHFTTVKIPTTKRDKTIMNIFTYDEFKTVYEVEPHEFIDVKALMGDSSDNIPGVPGIGEKTAFKLIKLYGNIDKLYQNIKEVPVGKKILGNLTEFKEQAYLSKMLATIKRDIEDISLEQCLFEDFDRSSLYEIFKSLEFNSLLAKLDIKNIPNVDKIDEEQSIEYESCSSLSKPFSEELHKTKSLIYFCLYENGEIKKVALTSTLKKIFIFDFKECYSSIKKIMEDKAINKIGYDLKRDIVFFTSNGINIVNVKSDVMIAAYVLDSSSNNYSLPFLSSRYLDINMPEIEGASSDDNFVNNYICIHLSAIHRLNDKFIKELQANKQLELYQNIEMPLVETLASLEIEGFKVDVPYIDDLGQKLENDILLLTNKIFTACGEEFNINSPKQLGVILFEKLGLPVISKTKTGYSTNIDVLNDLKGKHEVIEYIINYRQFTKLKSTYIEGLKSAVKEDGRIHSSFNQTVVATGRISSTEPNLQNIPIKLEYGRLIRKAFIPENSDCVLVDADYSQIELRVLAHLSEDENLINAFLEGQDIHAITAAKIFDVPLEEVSSFMRSSAKAVNFGIVYGISDFGLSKDLSITKKEAKKYIDSYFEKYPGIKVFMDKTIEFAKDNMFVETMFNRRRYIPEINSKSFVARSAANRVAMNTPVQGSAADIIKIAMVNVYTKMKKLGLKSKLILQVHDELIIEAQKDEKDIVVKLLKEEMENAVQLKVPLDVDINEGDSWYETK